MGHKPPGKGKDRSKLPRVLNDHVRDGKKFRPKLLDSMLKTGQGPPTHEWVQWALPEMLWIKFLIHEYGIRQAGELVCASVEAGKAVATVANRSYCMASDYAFTKEEQAKFIHGLGEGPTT